MLQSALIGLGLKAMVALSTDLSTKANQPLYKLLIGTSYGSTSKHIFDAYYEAAEQCHLEVTRRT